MSVIVQGLSKHFGTQKAVDNLSFEAHPGQILGFLGPNGAGKTTTMKMLCCYTEPTEGTASVEGYDIKTSPNPVNGIMNISIPTTINIQAVDIKISDVLGREILRTNFNSHLDISALENGIYFVWNFYTQFLN